MNGKKGFTLVELMVVVLIVGILAAVSIPLMQGRVDAAKWSEGKAGGGSIHTAARAFQAEKGAAYDYSSGVSLWSTAPGDNLGFIATDLNGTYFLDGCYSISMTVYNTYTISVDSTAGTTEQPTASPTTRTLTVTAGNAVWSD